MKITLELRAAEGGQDAKLLVLDQAAIYRSFAQRVGASVRTLDTGLG